MSPLRDPLGFDGSHRPAAGSGQPLLRRLLPGFDLWWNWRQSQRAARSTASGESESEGRAEEREPDRP